MADAKLSNLIEALLFSSGEPLSLARLVDITEATEAEIKAEIEAISKRYESGALKVIQLDDCYQITTKPEFAPPIRKMLEIIRNTPLSTAAFEVLAVVAYNQPVTKSFIEQVRGVDCSGVVSSLVEKGLIEEKGRLELPGRPLIYGTTKQFLRCFEMKDLSELPPLPTNNENTENYENESESGIDIQQEGIQ